MRKTIQMSEPRSDDDVNKHEKEEDNQFAKITAIFIIFVCLPIFTIPIIISAFLFTVENLPEATPQPTPSAETTQKPVPTTPKPTQPTSPLLEENLDNQGGQLNNSIQEQD